MNTVFTTPKGTKIELVNLKGKSYMLVAHRLLWMNEEVKSFTIDTNYLKLEDDYAVCRSVVTIYGDDGKLLKQASATKKETKKDFPDFLEKVETSATGRALAMLGYGTAQSLADFDEGMRLADAPLEAPKKSLIQNVKEATLSIQESAEKFLAENMINSENASGPDKPVGSFRRAPKAKVETNGAEPVKSSSDALGWR
jgi:hypothetical protein